ncbi:MAG: glucose-1-phosphate cytidylyltransferase [Myxococcales bacterium]|nr:glucose-1-phosphate cytidylyltransferase [Myxococcales bacterium]
MKAVILAGGLGTRLAEKTDRIPKPMVEIGGRPILWHIMKIFAHHGVNEFVVALGYRGEEIKRFFLDYYSLNSDLTVDLASGDVTVRRKKQEPWKVHLVDTGQSTLTGGRVARLKHLLNEETFMVTYGDGVANVDITAVLEAHRRAGRLATVTAVRPPARYGGLLFQGNRISEFTEKPQTGEGWINGGFLAFEPGIFDYLPGDDASLEVVTLERLAREGQLTAYRHPGFWQCMDTMRDVNLLETLWRDNEAPWKVWAA